MQVTLTEDNSLDAKVLLFGDLAYDTITKIFDNSEYHSHQEFLEWDLLLAPHHCSKKVMYVREDGEDKLRRDILDKFEEYGRDGAVVVASSQPIPVSNAAGDNPPHRKAANRYQERFRFICTMEWPSLADPSPVVLAVGEAGAYIVDDEVVEDATKALTASGAPRRRLTRIAAAATTAGQLAGSQIRVGDVQTDTGPDRVRAAVDAGRGRDTAPPTAVGFGRG